MEILRHHLANITRFAENAGSEDAREIAESFVDSLHPAYRVHHNGLGRESFVAAVAETVRHIQQRRAFQVIRDCTSERDHICASCSRNRVIGNHSCEAEIVGGLSSTVEKEEWPYYKSKMIKQRQILK